MSTRMSGVPLTIISIASGVVSTILQHFLKASPISFAAEIGVGLVLAITKSVNVVVGAVLANNRGGAPKAFPVAIVMVARAQAGSVRFDIFTPTLSVCAAESTHRKKCRYQNKKESSWFQNLMPAVANGSLNCHLIISSETLTGEAQGWNRLWLLRKLVKSIGQDQSRAGMNRIF